MPTPNAVILNGAIAEQHSNTLQGLYDFNKQGVAAGGLFLEQVLDVIRSLRGQTTEQEAFVAAWEGHEYLEGVLLQRYFAGLRPDGSPVLASTV